LDIRILGIGNVLMGDDGFGPYVIEALSAGYEFPSSVTLTDAGTPGLDLAPFLIGADVVIVIDTVRSNGPAGALRVYGRDAILAHPPQHRLGPHDPGFTQTLLTLDFAGRGPAEVLLVGVIPGATVPCPTLSAPVRDAVPGAVQIVLTELKGLGAAATPRTPPAAFAPWWEQSVA
jgi:hydrogenase maturation protease